MTERRYTPRGSTWDPCPVCKASSEPRPRLGICGGCRRTFELAKQREAEEAAKPSEEQRRPYYLQEREYALPYLPAGLRDDRDKLQHAFFELGQLLSAPSALHGPPSDEDGIRPDLYLWPFVKHSSRWHEWRVCRTMLPAHRDALHELFDHVRAALESAHAEGFSEGRNLLAQLASGAITMDRFNEVTTREESSL